MAIKLLIVQMKKKQMKYQPTKLRYIVKQIRS